MLHLDSQAAELLTSTLFSDSNHSGTTRYSQLSLVVSVRAHFGFVKMHQIQSVIMLTDESGHSESDHIITSGSGTLTFPHCVAEHE